MNAENCRDIWANALLATHIVRKSVRICSRLRTMAGFEVHILPRIMKFWRFQCMRKRAASNCLFFEGARPVGEAQLNNFAIKAVRRQTMTGMSKCEFPDRKHEGTAANELLQMANTREFCS